jgi:spermidine/putrescine transport system permease protein
MQVAFETRDAARRASKHPGWIGWLLLLPMILWLLAFVAAPTGILLIASFTHADDDTGFPVYHEKEPGTGTYTTENYKRIVLDEDGQFLRTEEEDIVVVESDGSEKVAGTRKVTSLAAPYLRVFAWSLVYAGLATFICVVVGYPVAWHIGRARETLRNRLLLLVMIPFWTSFLIRTYAWLTILANEGLLNGMLLCSKAITEPFGMLYTPGAVVLALVYTYLPFMILPIYGSIEKLDPSLVEAALDLGASPFTTFRRVILPLTRPGVATGILLVFVPAVGMYAISTLMGGGKSPMIGDVLQNQLFAGRDWPFGSALGITLVLMFVIAFMLTSRLRSSVT